MFFIWLGIAILLQATVFSGVLNLLVIFSVFSGMRKGIIKGFLTGGIIGILVGVFSIIEMRLSVLLYSVVGCMSGVVRTALYYKDENLIMQFLFPFCGVLLFHLLYFLLTNRFYPAVFCTAVFSGLVAPIIFRIVR